MTENNINDIIMSTYNNNIDFLRNHHAEVYKKIELLESAIQNQLYTQKYDLEYKESYFDVYQHINSSFLYNQDSYRYSKDIINKMTFDEVSDNFKPYKRYQFNEETVRQLGSMDIMKYDLVGLAPISYYIDKNSQNNQNNTIIHKFIFFGMGLGLHLQEVHNKFNCKSYFICEPDLELFRLSLFTTDYNEFANSSRLIFSIADTNEEFEEKCDIFLKDRYILNYNIKINLFSENTAYLIKLFQSKVVCQSFITYAYEKQFAASEIPLEYSKRKYNFLELVSNKNRTSILSKYPILLLSAGCSLLKNKNWLIENHKKFIVITVSSNLRFLYEINIKPDIIIHIDQHKEDTLENISNINIDYFEDSTVILSSVTHPEFCDKFKKNTKFIMQSIINYFSDLGRLFAPSVGEILYAFSLLYGAKEIYLLGLDLALDPETNQSHFGNHIEKIIHDEINYSYKRQELDLDKNHIAIKGNLRKIVTTTSRFYISILKFNYYTKVLKKPEVNIYNLNDGVYLEGTQPLKIENLNTYKFPHLNKSEIGSQLNQDLLSNSKTELTSYDKKVLKRKLKNAKYIKNLIRIQSSKIDYKETSDFLSDFDQLINKISKGENKTDSEDLNKTLFEYTRLVSHYIYNFCEQSIHDPNEFIHLKEINSIFTTQLLKIVDKYIYIYI